MGTTTPAVGATPAVTLLVRCGGLFRFGRVASARPFAHALQLRAEELTDLTREEIKHDWSVDEVMALFEAPLNDLLFQAQSIHRRYHTPNEVQISTLFSIKTGGCPEDCKFCPQSIHYDTGLDLHNLLGVETALTVAAEVGADLSRFATAAHFCSWLGLAPGDAHQWRQAPGRPVGKADQPGRPGVAHGGEYRPQQQDHHRRGASPAPLAHGLRQGGQGHRPSTGTADVRDAGPAARSTSNATWRPWKRSAATARSNTCSVKHGTSTWRSCRRNKPA